MEPIVCLEGGEDVFLVTLFKACLRLSVFVLSQWRVQRTKKTASDDTIIMRGSMLNLRLDARR